MNRTEAIVGQTGCKITMESQDVSNKETEIKEDVCCILLNVMIDWWHKHAKIWLSSNGSIENMI